MRFLFPIIFILASVLIVFGVTEATIRLTGAWVEKDYDNRNHFRDPGISGVPYILKPNLNLVWSGKQLTTNSLGLVDPHEPSAATSCWRLLVIGSSTTQGFGVERDEAYPRLLERELNAASKNCVEVINAAQDAYTVREKAALLKYLMPLYRPQLVLVDLNPFDFDDSLAVNAEGALWEPPNSVHKHQWFNLFWDAKEDPLEPYFGFSYTYRYFRPRVMNLFAQKTPRPRSAIFISPFFRKRFEDGLHAIEKAAGSTPLVFMPMGVPYSLNQFAPTSRVVDSASLVGESYEKFLNRYSLVWDPHPNAKGHALLAHGLRNYFAQNKWVDVPVEPPIIEYDAREEAGESARIVAEAEKNFASEIDFKNGRNVDQLVSGIGADLIYDGVRAEVSVVLRVTSADTLVLRAEGMKSSAGAMSARIIQGEKDFTMPFAFIKGESVVRRPLPSSLSAGLVDVSLGCQKILCGSSRIDSISLINEKSK